MKKIAFFISILLFTFAACDREFENEVLDITPPELHVIVRDANGARVSAAQVRVYNSQASFESLSGEIATGTTDGNGLVVFTKQDLVNPGIFFVDARKDGLSNTATTFRTRYLLLNDGQTHFFTTIQ
jgi:hypothetical protein